MTRIKKKYIIKAPINKVWQALVDPKEITAWGAGPAEMSDKPGADFSIWGGDIFGKTKKLIHHINLCKIGMAVKIGSNPLPRFSIWLKNPDRQN